MKKQDRQKLGILVVLLAVLGLTVFLAYRMNQPSSIAAVQPAQQKPGANPPAASEAHIRLDLLENSEASEEEIGKRNLFQYRQAPPPPPANLARGNPPPVNVPPPVNTTPQVTGPPPPPPPPPINLRFQGFALTSEPNGGLTAFLADDARHYNVKAGEILMGRYRIVSISEKSVEVEDLEYNRRQMLPLLN